MFVNPTAGGLARSTLLGIGASIAAGALWGLVFLAPELAPGFLPIHPSAGRYLAYGLVAALLIYPAWGRLRRHLGWLVAAKLLLICGAGVSTVSPPHAASRQAELIMPRASVFWMVIGAPMCVARKPRIGECRVRK